MKLQQLQTLVAVVDEGGIRAAARRLGVSQAAITKAMRLLEEEAGVPLLLRRSRGIDLTEAGQRLLVRARLIARQVDAARAELRQAADGDGGTVAVGVTPFVTLTALGEAFRWFRQRYAAAEVQLIEGLVSRVLPRLRDGTLDLAVVAADVGELPDPAFDRQVLLTTPQCVVVREGHPVLADPSAAALAALEWVFTAPADAAAQPGSAAMFRAAGVAPPQRVVRSEALAALALLRHADVASVVPLPLLGHPETRGIVPVPGGALRPSDIELLLLRRPDVPLTPAAAYFAHCLGQVAAPRGQRFAAL